MGKFENMEIIIYARGKKLMLSLSCLPPECLAQSHHIHVCNCINKCGWERSIFFGSTINVIVNLLEWPERSLEVGSEKEAWLIRRDKRSAHWNEIKSVRLGPARVSSQSSENNDKCLSQLSWSINYNMRKVEVRSNSSILSENFN